MAERIRLTTDNIKRYSNKVVDILKNSTGPVSKAQLCESLGLSIGQLSTIIKYMRRCSLEDLERYIPYYPISCRRGYTLPRNYRDFLPCYYTLYNWSESLKKTIKPMELKMIEEGIDICAYAESVRDDHSFQDNYLSDLDEINKTTSWFLEKEEN